MSKTLVQRTRVLAVVVPAVFALLAGCASRPDADPERVASTDEAIIGGVAASSASMNAVGALVTITRYSDPYAPGGERLYYGSPFCSATLIGNNAVLTAKHCVDNLNATSEFGFAIGPDARSPTRVVPVAEFETEATIAGGVINKGSDVAVLHLETKVEDVEPFAWSTLDAADNGTRFIAVGYGTQNVSGASGTRRAGSLTLRGTEGKLFELAFGTFDAFKAKVASISDLRYEIGDVNTPEGATRARTVYDSRLLLAGGYEALAGNLPGDAQTLPRRLRRPVCPASRREEHRLRRRVVGAAQQPWLPILRPCERLRDVRPGDADLHHEGAHLAGRVRSAPREGTVRW